MTDTPASPYVYVTYIRTTPEQLWNALTRTEFVEQYWFGMHHDTSWKPGTPWSLHFADGRIADAGEVVAFEPNKRIVLKWRNEFRDELKAEDYSRCTFELEPVGDAVKLTITHAMEHGGAKFLLAVAGGWPRILSNLKSLLETGAVILKG